VRSRFFAFVTLIGLFSFCPLMAHSEEGGTPSDHVAWVAQCLRRMETIKRGMNRHQLLSVFTTEGGLSTGLRRTFVSQDSPYFKVE
jgi:hypothetical protein